MYKVLFTEEAKSAINKLTLKKKRQIKDALQRIANNPSIGKRLTHELTGLLSYRSGDYRIIYRIYHNQLVIIVLTVGHRKSIYNNLRRK